MTSNPGVPGYKRSIAERLKSGLRHRARMVRRRVRARWLSHEGEAGSVLAKNVVWIFGSGRTGSTWLAAIMGEISNQTVWSEPLVGALFGNFYYVRAGHRADEYFILSAAYKDVWFDPVRDLILGGATARFPEATGPNNYLVIKEPNGSIGAPLLMEALPESRMVLLIRDPRDAVASSMDARREGSWQYENRNTRDEKRGLSSDENPNMLVKTRANTYLRNIGNAKQAYDIHTEHKVLVRYEELRSDTLGTMKRLYSELGIPVDEKELLRAVNKHAWENIPEDQKGEGKFYRKAEPGGWREDLTPEQAKIVERVTGPLLEELYP